MKEWSAEDMAGLERWGKVMAKIYAGLVNGGMPEVAALKVICSIANKSPEKPLVWGGSGNTLEEA